MTNNRIPDYQSIERGPTVDDSSNNNNEDKDRQVLPEGGHGGHGGLSTKAAAILIAGEMAGSGVLAIPKAVVDSGWMGLIMVTVLCGNAWFCATKLGICWEIIEERYPEQRQFSRNPYPTIASKASGRFASLVVSGCMQVTLFGAGVVYLLLASQIVQDLFHPLLPNVTFCSWFVLFSLIIIPPMWLRSPKDFWIVGVGALLTTTCSCVFMIAQIGLDWANSDRPPAQHKPKGIFPFFLSFGIIMFAFGGASTFPTIQNDMIDKSKFKKSAIIGFIAILLLYFPVAVGGYIVYGDSVTSNIVLSLGRGPFVTVANICMALHLILAFLIVVNPICQEIENVLDVPRDFCILRCIVRTAMVLVMLVIGETVPDFSKLLSLVGGSTIALATFVLPNYFYMKLCDIESPLWPKREVALHTRVYMWQLMLIGVVGGAATTYSAMHSILDSKTHSQSCFHR